MATTLTSEAAREILVDLWARFQLTTDHFDRIHGYKHGIIGIPDAPEKAPQHLKDLAPLAVDNIFPLVCASFTDPLRVDGFTTSDSDTNAAGWDLWQARRMDARQVEVISPANDYGKAYIARHPVLGPQIRSPRMAFAVYEHDEDPWPISAFFIEYDDTQSASMITVRAYVYADDGVQEFVIGSIPRTSASWKFVGPINPTPVGDPIATGFAHPPVVKFVNSRDSEYDGIGEVAPLVVPQRAINAVNYVSLVVATQGGFPQKYIAGWDATDTELQQASAANIMRFSDADVKVGSFKAADLGAYDKRLEAMKRSAFMAAQVSPDYMAQMVNLAAEAIAMARWPYELKLRRKQASYGESWEQWIRLDAAAEGIEVPDDAEVRWAEIESRSYAAVIDGIQKLAAASRTTDATVLGELVEDVPGWSPQRIERFANAVELARGRGLLQQLVESRAQGTSGINR